MVVRRIDSYRFTVFSLSVSVRHSAQRKSSSPRRMMTSWRKFWILERLLCNCCSKSNRTGDSDVRTWTRICTHASVQTSTPPHPPHPTPRVWSLRYLQLVTNFSPPSYIHSLTNLTRFPTCSPFTFPATSSLSFPLLFLHANAGIGDRINHKTSGGGP